MFNTNIKLNQISYMDGILYISLYKKNVSNKDARTLLKAYNAHSIVFENSIKMYHMEDFPEEE